MCEGFCHDSLRYNQAGGPKLLTYALPPRNFPILVILCIRYFVETDKVCPQCSVIYYESQYSKEPSRLMFCLEQFKVFLQTAKQVSDSMNHFHNLLAQKPNYLWLKIIFLSYPKLKHLTTFLCVCILNHVQEKHDS